MKRTLADLVDERLGEVPSAMLVSQQRRWRLTVAGGSRSWNVFGQSRLAFVAMALVAVVLVVFGARWFAASGEGLPVAAGVLVEGGEYDFSVPASGQGVTVTLAPGETLDVSPGASGSARRVGVGLTAVALASGQVGLKLPSGTGRHWAVEAGPYRVEVVGTVFTVRWEPDQDNLEVAVREGRVRVHGAELGEAGRLLGPGERLRAGAVRPAEPVDDPSDVEAAPIAASADPQTPNSVAAPSVPATWGDLSRARRYRDALTAAEREGFDKLCATLGAGALLQLADTARLAGSGQRARQSLLALRARYAKTVEAATAAFLLGRGGKSSEHARWLETYLTEQPRGSYSQEALGRLLVMQRSTKRARQYLAEYPGGPYADHARSVLGTEAAPAGR